MQKFFIYLLCFALIVVLISLVTIIYKKKTKSGKDTKIINNTPNGNIINKEVEKTPKEMMNELKAKKEQYEEELPVLKKRLEEEQEKYYSDGSVLCEKIGHAYVMQYRDDFTSYEKHLMEEDRRRISLGLPSSHPNPANRIKKWVGTCPICNKQIRTIDFFSKGNVSEHFIVPADKAKRKIDNFKKKNANRLSKIEELQNQISEYEKFLSCFDWDFKELCGKQGHKFEIIEKNKLFITRKCKICGRVEKKSTKYGKKHCPFSSM